MTNVGRPRVWEQQSLGYLLEKKNEIGPTHAADSSYISQHPAVSWTMVGILLDWMYEVGEEYNLLPRSVHLGKAIFERYMKITKTPVIRERLQLVGTCALFLACKFEEMWAPGIDDFIYITDYSYEREQVLECEMEILRVLQYQVTYRTPVDCLQALLQVYWAHSNDNDSDEQRVIFKHLCGYFLDLSHVSPKSFLTIPPPTMALTALILAHTVYPFTETWAEKSELLTYTKYTSARDMLQDPLIVTCTRQLGKLWKRAPTSKLQAVREKYMRAKYYTVASRFQSTPINIHLEQCD